MHPPSTSGQACAVSYRRLRAIGEPLDMLVDNLYERNVGYVVVEVKGERQPVGTVFFVGLDLVSTLQTEMLTNANLDPKQLYAVHPTYAVTCRHVIEAALNAGRTFLRLNKTDGGADDIVSVSSDWVHSERTDISISRLSLPRGFDYWPYPLSARDSTERDLIPGCGVFFVGMFRQLPGSGVVQALVRSGTIARPHVAVPIEIKPGIEQSVEAHLVEARSWGGESGSPVFVYDEYQRTEDSDPISRSTWISPGFERRYFGDIRKPRMIRASEVHPELLGLLYGHFEIPTDVTRGEKRIGGVAVNSGIAVVIPVSEIIKTLMSEPLMDDRRALMEEQKARALRRLKAAIKPDDADPTER